MLHMSDCIPSTLEATMAEPEPLDTRLNTRLKDQLYGVIYGNCIGDAIGLLTEFLSKSEAKEVYGEHSELEYEHKLDDFHRARWKTGDWTDDSDQMILIMQSIVDREGQVDPVDFGQKLLHWARKGFPELGDFVGMGIGSTTSHVLRHKKYASDPHAAAEDIWKETGSVVAPNGAVMRTGVLGVYQFDSPSKVIQNAKSFCKATHADPRCQASCVAVTLAVSFMLQRQERHLKANGEYNINAIITEAYKTAKQCLGQTNYKKYKKELKHYMFASSLRDLKLDDKDGIGYTFKAMGAGFWALKQSDFRTALQRVLMEGGDADTNGAVAGALLGCKLGASKLPATWLNGLLHKDWLDEKIARFFQLLPGLKGEQTADKDRAAT